MAHYTIKRKKERNDKRKARERKARTRKEKKNNRQNGKWKGKRGRLFDYLARAWSAADKSCEKLRKTVKTFQLREGEKYTERAREREDGREEGHMKNVIRNGNCNQFWLQTFMAKSGPDFAPHKTRLISSREGVWKREWEGEALLKRVDD